MLGVRKMKIRKANLKDKKQFLKLVRYLYAKSSPKNYREWKRQYEDMFKIALISEANKKIIAFITFVLQKDSIYICDLYVLPKYRKKGVATSLLKKVDKIRKNLGKKYLKVNNRKKDMSAFKLYTKFGFKITNEKKSIKLRK